MLNEQSSASTRHWIFLTYQHKHFRATELKLWLQTLGGLERDETQRRQYLEDIDAIEISS